MPADERRPHSPQSVLRVIQILEALAASERPLSLADLSRILAAPKSSMAALLRGLADADFVVGAEGVYRLGPGAFGLGGVLLAARRRVQTSDLVRDGMRRLAERSGETVIYAVRDEDAATMTYVDVIESRNAVRFSVAVGDRRPLYCTAGGRVFLAERSDEELQRYFARLKPEKLATRTETSKARLAEEVAKVRAAGVAHTIDQAADGLTGTAAPVRDAAGAVVGVLVVAAPSLRHPDAGARLMRLVRDEATAISRGLGHRAPG
jgi:DNA-binding IclR family transcriptional regulator